MAFDREEDTTKDEIGDFTITLFVPGASNPTGVQTGELVAQLIISDGSTRNRRFDLLARLADDAAGQTHLANLASLRDYIRTRLEDEVLPL